MLEEALTLQLKAKWPPVVTSVENLGYLADKDGITYPRDIGRSAILGRTVMFVFGDTFSFDERSVLLGLTSSTTATLINGGNPVLSFKMDMDLLDNGVAACFIPMFDEEVLWTDKRVALWCFGGIIFDQKQPHEPLSIVTGWVFFQCGVDDNLVGNVVYQYTGLAILECQLNKLGQLDIKDIEVTRIKEPYFTKDEPMFGTFSTLEIDGFVYLYGHAVKPDDKRVMLARVELTFIQDKEKYLYWDGEVYQPDINLVQPVMIGMQHGAIHLSDLFGVNSSRRFVFIGCNNFTDNKVMIGTSDKPEGPFEMAELTETYNLTDEPRGKYNYCIYPHPWAFNGADGELMVTWCEGGVSGQVVAVKIKLQQEYSMVPTEQEDLKQEPEDPELPVKVKLQQEHSMVPTEQEDLKQEPEDSKLSV